MKNIIIPMGALLSAILLLSMQCAGFVNIDGTYDVSAPYGEEKLPYQCILKRGSNNTITGTWVLKLPAVEKTIKLADLEGKLSVDGVSTILTLSVKFALWYTRPVERIVAKSPDAKLLADRIKKQTISLFNTAIKDATTFRDKKGFEDRLAAIQKMSVEEAFVHVIDKHVRSLNRIAFKVLDNGAALEDVDGQKFRKK